MSSSLAALQAERDVLLRSAREKDAELSSLRQLAQQQQGSLDLERDRLSRELEALRAQLQQQVRTDDRAASCSYKGNMLIEPLCTQSTVHSATWSCFWSSCLFSEPSRPLKWSRINLPCLSTACHQCRAEVRDRQAKTRAGLDTSGVGSYKQRPAKQRNGMNISSNFSDIVQCSCEKKHTLILVSILRVVPS